MSTRRRGQHGQIAAAVAEILAGVTLSTPCLLCFSSSAIAQERAPHLLSDAIAPQPLAQALDAFAQQTGLQVVYLSAIIRNQRSHAVAAGLDVDKALARMLQGTGLQFEYLTPHSIRIVDARAHSKSSGSITNDQPEEVIVTANRRKESLQDVPMTIQVLTGKTLEQLNATTFDDFVSHLPGVISHGVGPAQNSIYIRGLGTGEYGAQAAGSNGSFPNVAVYLDEQSASLPSRNLDLYAADLERIEVLEGPQGTLFGAGAQAGVLRYITNKPRLNATSGNVKAAYAITAHGDPSTALEAVINFPIIPDTLAVRALIYNEARGGYIDNTPATFARSDTDRSISYANYPAGCNPFPLGSCKVPPNSVVINNAALAASSINPVTYQGIRIQGLYQFSPEWSVLLAQSYQSMKADGVFTEMAADSLGKPQPSLTVQLFNPSYDKDRFENSALTIDGHLRDLKLLYAGSYFVRNVEQLQDYTNYARGGFFADYYQCVNPEGTDATARCFTPSTTWHDRERNTHQSHELRLSTPDDWRLRAVSGVFYEKYRIQDQGDWFYLTALPYFYPIAPPTGATSNNPSVRPPGDGFFNDITRGYRQRAAYASLDFELIPHQLTLTAGARHYDINTTEIGSVVFSSGCSTRDPTAPNPCVNRDYVNLNAKHLDQTYKGFKGRAGVSWKPSDDLLLYYAWSQGFRAGVFNRAFVVPGYSPLSDFSYAFNFQSPFPWQALAHEHGAWTPAIAVIPDSLTNHEIGWKASWADGRLYWNGAVYQENWNHVQLGAFETDVLGSVAINGGNYRIRGIENSIVARPWSRLDIEIGLVWNHSELVKEAQFFWHDGTPIDFSLLHTYDGVQLSNPAGTLGSSLAGAPAFQGTVRARYEINLGTYTAFLQLGAVHQSHSLATTDRLGLTLAGRFRDDDLPPFTTYDGALGLLRDDWLVQLYAENLFDTQAQLFANYNQDYRALTVNRPRTIGLRFSYDFQRN